MLLSISDMLSFHPIVLIIPVVSGLIGWVLGWSLQAQGAMILIFGIYMAQAAGLHISESGRSTSKLITCIFAICLLLFGSLALLQ